MEEAIFPPSPSWFLPNIIAVRKDGSVSYGSKNNIVILKLENNKEVEFLIIPNAHLQRITALAFCPSNCSESEYLAYTLGNTLVSTSEDGFVKLWKIDTLTATIGHKCHEEKTGRNLGETTGRIICLDWSTANPYYIVSAENNTIVLWEILSNTTKKFSIQKLGATVISCCPYNEKIVAVGGKMGQICIISLTGNGEILYKLRGHDNKINSLSWCPIPYNVFKENEIHEEFLLASACQNKEVFVWRAGSDGNCEVKFQVPTSALLKKDGHYHAKTANGFSYVALNWLQPKKLYLSSNFGELIYFDIKSYVLNNSSGENEKQKSYRQPFNFIKLGHSFHSGLLYAIAGVPVAGEIVMYKNLSITSRLKFPLEANSKDVKKIENECERNATWDVVMPEFSTLLWTAGQDRKLIGCEVKPDKMEVVFNYNTTNGVVYYAVVSPHDPNKLAIGVGDGMIRLWNLTKPNVDIHLYWQKIKGRVMSLDWHPIKDGILAYGTSEGRVGLIDTKSNKLPHVFKPSHPQPIYKLSWGPQFPSDGAKVSTCKPEFDLYSIGDNTLSLYNCSKLNAHPLNLSKIIPFPCRKQTDVSWKSDYSVMAVGNEDGSICLVEPSEFKIVFTLLAYKKLIESLEWHPSSTSVDTDISPFHSYFTSASTDNDCEIRVFNCKTQETGLEVEQVATLKGHHGHVISVSWSPHVNGRLVSSSVDGSVQIWDVFSETPLINFTPKTGPLFSMWSPIDPDFILTGCRNNFLCVWRVSTQTAKCPQANVKTKKQKKEKAIHLSTAKELTAGDTETVKKSKNNPDEAISIAGTKSTAKKSSKELKMFSKIWKGDENEEIKTCFELLRNEENDSQRKYSLPFLCDEDYFKESVLVEEESLKKSNNWAEFSELALWNGNIKVVLEEKIKSRQLNDFLVSLAPVISPRLWQEACLAYSKSLAENKYYRKAASYLIVCHKIYEAIHLLMNANLYLEAIFIARSRFPNSDPILKEIVKKYAEWLYRNGFLLKACQCYMYLEDYLEVAKTCGKKSQAEYLSLAALAAKKCNSFNLECTEATNALLKCFESNNFELARQVCDDHGDLQHLGLFLFVYRTIHQLDTGEVKLSTDIVSHVREAFDTKTVTFPSCLPKLFHKYSFYRSKEQVYIIVAQELSFAACTESQDETITHVIKALSTCSRYIQNSNEVHPLYKLCVWLSPNGFLSSDSFFTLQNTQMSSKIKSLRAFLCASVVRHISDSIRAEDLLQSLELLHNLREDLLDDESFRYFKNLLEVEVCENRLLKNRSKLTKELTNGKVDHDSNLTLLEQISGQNNFSESNTETGTPVENEETGKNLENNEVYSEVTLTNGKVDHDSNLILLEQISGQNSFLETNTDTGIPVENEETGENPENNEVDSEVKLTDDNLKNFETASENCNGTVIEGEDDLERIVSSDLELLNRLKSEIERFESDRISVPNPVPIYCMLKKICKGIPENEFAKLLLQFLEKKWQELK